MNRRMPDAKEPPATIEEEASQAFVQRLQGEWTETDQAALEARLERDVAYADAYRRVEQSWGVLDEYAETPEIIARREKSLVYVRRASARRWITTRPSDGAWRRVAVAAGIAVLVAMLWQFSPYGYRPGLYQTAIGEQRLIDLEDHSRIALDAQTRVRIRYTQDTRLVELQSGQAQFYVARDPARPFKVQVGDRTIVALGTVFTVEYVERNVRLAMVEGRVAVLSPKSTVGQVVGAAAATNASATPSSARSGAPRGDSKTPPPASTMTSSTTPIELGAGEELRVAQDGRTTLGRADLESATAWREGKVIFRAERLDEAARRLNRYSRLQIVIDGQALAEREISGVFETGDTQGFVRAVERYYPVATEYVGTETVRLRMN